MSRSYAPLTEVRLATALPKVPYISKVSSGYYRRIPFDAYSSAILALYAFQLSCLSSIDQGLPNKSTATIRHYPRRSSSETQLSSQLSRLTRSTSDATEQRKHSNVPRSDGNGSMKLGTPIPRSELSFIFPLRSGGTFGTWYSNATIP